MEIAEAKKILPRLLATARPEDVSRWVIALLNEYYVKPLASDQFDTIADLWLQELQGYPAWAIEAAVRWWVGSENKQSRSKRPRPGDISEVIEQQMVIVRTAQTQISRYAKYGDSPPDFLKINR